MKVLETDTHVYFLNGPLSNWHIGKFQQRLEQSGELLGFNCVEQYMMAEKARYFGDLVRLKEIMKATKPWDQKALGRAVDGFDDERWKQHARGVVFRGAWAKFSQNQNLGKVLLNTGTKYLVEGNSKDKIWGVGLAWDNPAIQDQSNWLGLNWLGEVLMIVRTYLAEPRLFNVWTVPGYS